LTACHAAWLQAVLARHCAALFTNRPPPAHKGISTHEPEEQIQRSVRVALLPFLSVSFLLHSVLAFLLHECTISCLPPSCAGATTLRLAFWSSSSEHPLFLPAGGWQAWGGGEARSALQIAQFQSQTGACNRHASIASLGCHWCACKSDEGTPICLTLHWWPQGLLFDTKSNAHDGGQISKQMHMPVRKAHASRNMYRREAMRDMALMCVKTGTALKKWLGCVARFASLDA
jgi:hypothetical protein